MVGQQPVSFNKKLPVLNLCDKNTRKKNDTIAAVLYHESILEWLPRIFKVKNFILKQKNCGSESGCLGKRCKIDYRPDTTVLNMRFICRNLNHNAITKEINFWSDGLCIKTPKAFWQNRGIGFTRNHLKKKIEGHLVAISIKETWGAKKNIRLYLSTADECFFVNGTLSDFEFESRTSPMKDNCVHH
jgi:hypothetical protein